MNNLTGIFTILLLAAVLDPITACQSRAVMPLITTVPSTTPRNETPEPTLSPTASPVTPSPLSLAATATATFSPATIQPTSSPPPEPTLSHPPEETGAPDAPGNNPTPLSLANAEKINLGNLSGIVFHPQRKTLFAVSDNGYVIEFESGGTLVKQERVRNGADFEGITSHPFTGLLYVAIEGDDAILELNPTNLQVLHEIPIDRVFEGEVLLDPKGNGIEGITFVPDSTGATGGTFYLVNQSDKLGGKDPSIVFEVEIAGSVTEPYAKIVRYFTIGVTDLSGIEYDPLRRQLLVISDDNDLLMEVSLTGQVSNVYPLPGVSQEGIALDNEGFLYIAQDSEDGVLKFSPAEDGG